MAFDGIKKALFDNDNKDNSVEDNFYTISNKQLKEEESKNGSKMILVEPRAYSESQQIADYLKNRNSVVVNLKRVTSDQAKRLIDFLTGTIYAIGGSLQKLGNGIYLCTPNNVNVQGKMSESEEKEKAKTKYESDIEF
ncbi:MAG: cell division protein SepF [Bacilli bacterium]|nr:cell division protein SepF [Bacilli bacterium]